MNALIHQTINHPAACRHWIIVLILMAATAVPAQELDPAYHDLDEIDSELASLAEDFPDWVTVDSIGHSSEYGLPIMMAKLSDNPGRDEPEPALLLIGQIHAEEVIGVEIVLRLMRQLLENLDRDECRRRLEGLELYFIPTVNPEGLRVVHSGQDVTFRKNCRDNVGDGRFRYLQGIGGDSSGVDLNRNFSLHWDRGDTLFQPLNNEYIYNYYRGPEPFSEPETRAVRDLILSRRFIFSINYHSSRSGHNSELVIEPWYWDGRYPPDDRAINALGDTLAALIPSANGEWSYDCVRSGQRVGQEQEWAYQAAGTFMYLIEAGRSIQPDSTGLEAVVDANLDAAFFMMDLALGQVGLPGFGILSINVVDARSQEPLESFITVEELDDPVLEPRRTSELNGLFCRLMPAGDYGVSITQYGYDPIRFDSLEITDGGIVELQARLEPLGAVICHLHSEDIRNGEAVEALVTFTDNLGGAHPFNLEDGQSDCELMPGVYEMEVSSPGYVPLVERIEFDGDMYRTFYMFPSAVAYREDFFADRGWQRGGLGEDWGIVNLRDGRALTESPNGAYPNNMEAWLLLDTEVEIAPDIMTVVEIVHRPYFEPGRDFGLLEAVHPESGEIVTLATFSGFPAGWKTTRRRVVIDAPGGLVLGLRTTSDNRVNEDGWLIDRISVYQSTIPYSTPPQASFPDDFSLTSYPNPFNSSARVVMYLPVATYGALSIYNPMGRKVVSLADGFLHAGEHSFLLNGTGFPSGRYYLWLNTPQQRLITKMVIIR